MAWLIDFLTTSGHDRHLLKTIGPFRGPVNVRLQESPLNQLLLEDCITGLAQQPAGSVDLAFADPPFNIGYSYDVYADSKESQQYLTWCEAWIAAVYRALKSDGTFWLAIGDEYAAELKVAAQKIGFQTRSWVVWYYTFGVNCKFKFTRSHAHIFYFVKDREKFTFNSEDPANRIPSARQLVYADKRANPKGRLPDDTWVIHGRRDGPPDQCHLGSQATGSGRSLYSHGRYLVLPACGGHLQRARRFSRLPDARTTPGADHPHVLASGRTGA